MSATVTIDKQELEWMRETIRQLQQQVEELKAKQKEHGIMLSNAA